MSNIDLIGKKIESFLVSQRKIIQKLILVLAFLSLFLVFISGIEHETGEISLKLLWLILWIPIFAKVFSSKIAGKLMMFRKELGILMGTIAFVHSAQYFLAPDSYTLIESGFWSQDGRVTYLLFGILALIITIALTVTSNIWSMKKMGKYWKYLHRTVYIMLLLVLLHVAFIDIVRSENILLTILTSLIPFVIYFIFKIGEWKGIKLRKTRV